MVVSRFDSCFPLINFLLCYNQHPLKFNFQIIYTSTKKPERVFLFTSDKLLTYFHTYVRYEYINSLLNPLSRKGSAERQSASNGLLTLVYTKAAALRRTEVQTASAAWIFWFMWFTKKRIYKQIEDYGKDKDILLHFANKLLLTDACDLTQELIREYYGIHVMQMAGSFQRIGTMLAIRKFYRYLHIRGENCLKPGYIANNPFQTVDINVMIGPMKPVIKKGVGRPKDLKSIKKVKMLRDEGEMSFREIARALKRDVRQVHVWYHYKTEKNVDSLSTGK